MMTGDQLPVGSPVPDWTAATRPGIEPMVGSYCTVEPIDVERHAAELFEANRRDESGRNWTYLPYGPFEHLDDYITWMTETCLGPDPMFHAIVDHGRGAVGVASYLRIAAPQGSIEVGHINYSPLLQRQRAATEAMYLMMGRAFELGYRRYEWKCDALNAASCAAALRLGFTYEGVFRQASVVKGRNRDTAWYAMIDAEWPVLSAAFETWLAPENFDGEGAQRTSLSERTAAALAR